MRSCLGWGLDDSLGNGVDTLGTASVRGGRQRPCWLRAGREAGGAPGIKLHPPLEWPLRGEAPGAGSKALTWREVQPRERFHLFLEAFICLLHVGT